MTCSSDICALLQSQQRRCKSWTDTDSTPPKLLQSLLYGNQERRVFGTPFEFYQVAAAPGLQSGPGMRYVQRYDHNSLYDTCSELGCWGYYKLLVCLGFAYDVHSQQ
jgi:hypothetical protein